LRDIGVGIRSVVECVTSNSLAVLKCHMKMDIYVNKKFNTEAVYIWRVGNDLVSKLFL
jgi:hypothetical protein